MAAITAVLGRILLGAYFIVSGAIMVLAPGPSGAIYAAWGVNPDMAIAVGTIEVIAGLCLALGAFTRLMAVLLAAWTAFVIVLAHPVVSSPAEVPDILLQAALVGGLLLVFAHSQVWWSLDSMRRRRDADRAALAAEQRAREAEMRASDRARDVEERAVTRAHEAELRAARAEGAATGDPVRAPRRRWFPDL